MCKGPEAEKIRRAIAVLLTLSVCAPGDIIKRQILTQ